MAEAAKFRLGRLMITPGALDALAEAGQEPLEFLRRHLRGDWGDLPPRDRDLNDRSCANESDPERRGRLLSAYHTGQGVKLWVITECDRSATTLLLPEEY